MFAATVAHRRVLLNSLSMDSWHQATNSNCDEISTLPRSRLPPRSALLRDCSNAGISIQSPIPYPSENATCSCDVESLFLCHTALQHEVCARCRLIRFADMLTVLHGSLLSSYCGIAGFGKSFLAHRSIEYVNVVRLLMMTTAAMVLYEYIVTLGDEVDLFWKRKISSASIIFFLNRYLTILGYVLDSGTFHVQTDIVSSTQYRACLPLGLHT